MEAIVEQPAKQGFFNTENAKRYAAIGNQKRWDAFRAERESLKNNPPASEPVQPVADDSFVESTIGHVRAIMEKLLLAMRETADADAIEKQARAVKAVSSIEREYSMRPGPGTLKPTSAKPAKRQAAIEVEFDDVIPAPQIVNSPARDETTPETPATSAPGENQSAV